ncbi:MAG: SMI1/KNR4 family protein [Pseudomonadota bacterium]
MENIHQLLQAVKNAQHHVRYHPASAFTIEKAQGLFGRNFCDAYQYFLKHWGHLRINNSCVLGLSQASPSIHDKNSFLGETLQFRQKYLKDSHFSVIENCDDQWYFLLHHGNGKVYSFDPLQAKHTPNAQDLVMPEKESFTDYLHHFIENFIR